MDRKTDTHDLSYEVKSWLVAAIAGLLAVDGIIVRDEMGFIKEFSDTYLKDTPELQDQLASHVINKSIPELTSLKPAGTAELFNILDILIRTVCADKLIHDKESIYMIRVGEKLGLSRADIEERLRIEKLFTVAGTATANAELQRWKAQIRPSGI